MAGLVREHRLLCHLLLATLISEGNTSAPKVHEPHTFGRLHCPQHSLCLSAQGRPVSHSRWILFWVGSPNQSRKCSNPLELSSNQSGNDCAWAMRCCDGGHVKRESLPSQWDPLLCENTGAQHIKNTYLLFSGISDSPWRLIKTACLFSPPPGMLFECSGPVVATNLWLYDWLNELSHLDEMGQHFHNKNHHLKSCCSWVESRQDDFRKACVCLASTLCRRKPILRLCGNRFRYSFSRGKNDDWPVDHSWT